jgi:hypothetical protein
MIALNYRPQASFSLNHIFCLAFMDETIVTTTPEQGCYTLIPFFARRRQ